MSGGWRLRAGTVFETEKVSAAGSLGMVVTNNPLGSAAGTEMLAAGGNAFDAAVASLFALTVVEPMMVGIFGAGMSTMRLASGEHRFINNYTVAPAAATPDMFEPVSNTWPDYQKVKDRKNDIGVLATGVPGTLMGWFETLDAHGTMSLDDVMQPAIRYAERGFPATPYLCELVRRFADDLSLFPETAKTYLPGGNPITPGTNIRQPEYAASLRLIASEGPRALYEGSLGQIASDYILANGGLITRADLAAYRTTKADVVRGTYRGYDIVGPPPPTAGGVHVIEMLNMLEAYDVESMGFGSVESVHLMAEVLKLGFDDRRRYTGDPAFVDVPVEMLIDKAYAAERRGLIDLARAGKVETAWNATWPVESAETTHMAAADRDGNVIAATHTIHSAFGAKATVPGTGILLNNTMNIFDPHPGTANSIEPGKRVTSSMSPIIVEKDGKPSFCVGLVGGIRIFPSALQAIVNRIDHGMTPQEAVEAPRLWTLGEDVELEEAFPQSVRDGLASLGHRITDVKLVGAGMGMIAFDGNQMTGASCWRADGTPIGLGGGHARKGMRFDV